MRIGRLFAWCLILQKRFLKKTGFLLLLALIPLSAFLLLLVSDMESGMLTVCVASEDDDALSAFVIESLAEDDGVVRFIRSDALGAKDAVEKGRADAALILRSELSEHLKSFARRQSANNYLVTVYCREDDASLMLLREKISGVLYPFIAHEFYIDYVKANIVRDAEDTALEEYYSMVMPEGSELFEVADDKVSLEKVTYLTAPLRGLLAVLCVLGGLAASMFFKNDESNELFIRISDGQIPLFRFIYHFIAVLDMCAVMLISLYIAGLFGNASEELSSMLLFCLSTVLFCLVLERSLFGVGALAALSPLLTVGMLVICPVFLHVKELKSLAYLFPPYHYLTGSASGMLVYIVTAAAIYAFLCLILPRNADRFLPRKANRS